MNRLTRILITLIFLAVPFLTAGLAAYPAAAAPTYTCFPSCSPTDGRFLTLAGSNLQTLAGDTIRIEIAVQSTKTGFELGIFDGETGGYWDIGTTPSRFALFADPLNDGTGSVLVTEWQSSSTTPMPDNAWFNANITNVVAARAPSGNYFYHLDVINTNPVATSANSFKVRVDASISLLPQAFAFVAPLNSTNDAKIIYPGFPTSLAPTTYDGSWDLYVYVPSTTLSFAVWDGDLDYGTYDCSLNDTNDLDTPAGLPAWAVGTAATLQGVAVTAVQCVDSTGKPIVDINGNPVYTTGDPSDDNRNVLYNRAPAINYDVIMPDGTVYHNGNTSGNLEWEQFNISSTAADVPALADFSHTGLLPAGRYHIHMSGVDMHNLNAWRFGYNAEGVCDNATVELPPTPCKDDPHPYLVGDTVWNDANGNGVQEAGEAGIANVNVTLVSNGLQMAQTLTDGSGKYTFEVEKGTYKVQIATSNFAAGGALAGFVSTTGGESQTNTVVNNNILTYDFGYRQPASIGDRVWFDANANGVQDTTETGLPNVKVSLLDAGGATLATKITGANGIYTFSNLLAGPYTVVVDPSTLPAGMKPTYDLDGGLDNKAAASVIAGQNLTTVDFGYTGKGSIGDRVWLDADADGLQDAVELGVAGVPVNLLDASGNPIAGKATTTDASGKYLFNNLPAGTYIVQFVAPTTTSGFTTAKVGSDNTKDSDPNATTGRTAPITLAAAQNNLDVDAGLIKKFVFTCPNNLVLNPSFELNTGTPPTNWTNGTAGTINVPAVDGKNVGFITGSGSMYQNVNVTAGYSYTLTFYSGSHNPYKQTLKLQYFNASNVALGTASVHTISSDLEVSGFGGPYTLNLGAAPTDAKYLRIMVSANNYDYAKVDALCLKPKSAPATASIGDLVWKDTNTNGLQDTGEPGLAGVTVKLLDAGGNAISGKTATTDTNGKYLFSGLAAGTYKVQFVAPSGYYFAAANVGANDAKDSDPNSTTGVTAPITVAVGQSDLTQDAGLTKTSTCGCANNLVLNPSFEFSTGTPPMYWTNGTAGSVNVPAVDGKNVGYISGSGVMSQNVNITVGLSYKLTFYSGSHNPSIQTVKIQYYNASNVALGTASVHTITSDLEVSGFGGPYSLSLGAAPADAKYLRISVSANGQDYAKVDALCLQVK